MFVQIAWNSGTDFECEAGEAHVMVSPPAPKNHKLNFSPFELFLSSLGSSTGLEMIRYMNQVKIHCSHLSISVTGHLIPKYQTKIFSSIELLVDCETDDDPAKILNALEISQFETCGISAMMSKFISINWKLVVNGKMMGEGIPNFQEPNENVY